MNPDSYKKTFGVHVTFWSASSRKTAATYWALVSFEQYSYSGDRVTSHTDGLSGLGVSYNSLDRPRKIASNGVDLANYSYLADGTLVDVEDGLGLGLVYRGSLIYKKLPSSLGSLEFESAGFEGGRVTPGGVKYHLTDHLGSVVMVLDGMSGTVDEANRYGEYGARTQLEGTSATAGRYHFSGKEDQDKTLGFPYTDFGARHYSPSLRRWLVQDPLSEKYYGISPYTYCDGDPVNSVDEEGDSIAILKPKASIHIAMLITRDLYTGNSSESRVFNISQSGVRTRLDNSTLFAMWLPETVWSQWLHHYQNWTINNKRFLMS